MSHQDEKAPAASGGLRRRKGFTLVDVMVAVGIASMSLMALIGTNLLSYKINHKARLRDNARSVLRTYVDQFQRLAYSDDSSGTNLIRSMFIPTTSGPTGLGLRWGNLSDETPNPDQPSVMEVDIGPPGSSQLARVTREVSYINPTNGEASTTRISDAAGFMIRGTFTITYTITGSRDKRPISQSISALRLID